MCAAFNCFKAHKGQSDESQSGSFVKDFFAFVGK